MERAKVKVLAQPQKEKQPSGPQDSANARCFSSFRTPVRPPVRQSLLQQIKVSSECRMARGVCG